LAAGGVLLAAIVVLAEWGDRGGSPRPAVAPALTGVSGRIVLFTANGGLALSDPGGGHLTPLPTLGQHAHDQPASVSLDGRFIVLGDGTLISIDARGLAVDPSPAPSPEDLLPYPDPLADHDLDLVVDSNEVPGATDISLKSLATGQARSLGVADEAEGDPQADGAFLSIAVPGPSSSSSVPSIGLPADEEVELDDVGRPPVVLATADVIDQDVSLAPGVAVNLTPLPDPAGDKVAIVVVPVDGGEAGLVTVGPSLGPSAGPPAWSPNGDQLAYATGGYATGGNDVLVVWPLGQAAQAHVMATSGGQPGPCLWSPDASAILCSTADRSNGKPTGWIIAPAGNAPLVTVSSSAQPLAWIP
jgi:hypothetical protein